jgi:hypothetical protein
LAVGEAQQIGNKVWVLFQMVDFEHNLLQARGKQERIAQTANIAPMWAPNHQSTHHSGLGDVLPGAVPTIDGDEIFASTKMSKPSCKIGLGFQAFIDARCRPSLGRRR